MSQASRQGDEVNRQGGSAGRGGQQAWGSAGMGSAGMGPRRVVKVGPGAQPELFGKQSGAGVGLPSVAQQCKHACF